ncbi:hypothetical protein [Halomonas sp. HG01]|uniref:hypothetical protein n=1 Tax=Halomonas sp. HG01 TaxID=1609967 RepID=UPI0006146BE6|nr:hypothetical protein [Halomonas sp. HG01]
MDDVEYRRAIRDAVESALLERMERPLTAEKVEATLAAAIGLTSHLDQWRATRNPHHVDMFLVGCRRMGIAPPAAASGDITEVAMLRMEDKLPPGSRTQVIRDAALEKAFILMMNLKFHGAPMAEAASKAARWLNDHHPDLKPTPYKASGLQRQYEKGWLNSEHEKALARVWEVEPSEKKRQLWIDLRAILPESGDGETGERR